jgi:transcriptional regulator with XRE-family HTH domain
VIIPLPSIDDQGARLGRCICRVREARGLSLERLAADAQLSASRLSLAEHGRARLTSAELHGVINALHIPLDLLFAADVDVSRLRRL